MTEDTPVADNITYAIGDVHGESGLLTKLLDKIRDHADGREHTIVALGDYCDRGPDSRGVFDLLRSRPEIVAIRGNHEDMLLRARDGGVSEVVDWLRNGGTSTCASFSALNVTCIPQEYIDWVRTGTRLVYEDARRVYVHAGVMPGTPSTAGISELVALWIRNEFLYASEPFFKYVVHGHTPTHKLKREMHLPEVLPNRCNLDTGAFRTGVLAAGVFDLTQDAPIDVLYVSAGRTPL